MSDLEEMDSDRLNELESILYASIHYNDAFSEEQQQLQKQQVPFVDADAQSMPPPALQTEQTQQHTRIVSNKRVINNATPKARYWTESRSVAAALVEVPKTQIEAALATAATSSVAAATSSSSAAAAAVEATATPEPSSSTPQSKRLPTPGKAQQKEKRTEAKSPKKGKQPNAKVLNPVQKLLQKQQQQKLQAIQKKQHKQLQLQQSPQTPSKQKHIQEQKPPKPQQNSLVKVDDSEPEQFDQRLLVALPQNWPPKRERAKREAAPFGKGNRKLEQFQRLAEKRQKTKRVQLHNKNKKQNKDQPIELISLVDSEKSSDNDDVIIVPLPPVPIIDVDTSDEEREQPQSTAEPYLEENAMDAADVQMGVECPLEQQLVIPASLHSPCNSVLSSDDFIVPKDTSRLLAERARATDEDLLVLTEHALQNAAESDTVNPEENELEDVADTSSEHEFVPPSRLEEIKQNYRVDEQQFRALDVYESESDLTESGIYCKAKQKAVPTIIRSVDSASDCSDVELVVETNVTKTKRLRKRRASSTNQSQSDPNNEVDSNDTDSDDGVQATGVPGIARGMAVERCKRKIRRISQRRSSEGAMPVAQPPRKAPIEEGSSDSAGEESLPTARQIAERLLKQEQAKETLQAAPAPAQADNDEAMDSIGSDANSADEAEMQDAMTERISAVFKRIDGSVNAEQQEQNQQQQEASTMEQETLEIVDEEHNLSIAETELEPLSEEEQAAEAAAVIQVEHNMAALKEQLSGRDLVGWSEEMCLFYNESWHGENFSLYKIQRGMTAQRIEWRNIAADRFPVQRKRSHLKCLNCLEMGHIRAKCPRPRKVILCSSCGMPGHAEPRCPNAICLGCGAKQTAYVQRCNKCSFFTRMICQLCKMRGHSTDMCPDKWRRYHSTTRSNVQLESKVPHRTKHCSYCGARGHLFEECRHRIGEYRYNNYTNHIVSYQKSYKDRTGPISYLTDLGSFFKLDTAFHFKWSSEFSKNSCYARFLKTVGLARLPPRQRKPALPAIELPPRIYTSNYVANPQATLAQSTKATSVIIEELPAEPIKESTVTVTAATVVAAASAQIQQKEISSNFLNKSLEARTKSQPSCTVVSKSTVTPHDLDSDSNYSFSEHFELPSSTTTTVINNEQLQSTSVAGPMDNLPEVIPLSLASDDEDLNTSSTSQGISMCVNSRKTLLADPAVEELPDIPCEAKIIIPRDQAAYLFSPEGRQFLTDSSKQCSVDVRIDFKEYGVVLVIYGLKKNQVNLQLMLLQRNQDVKRKSIEFQSQKPPKRIDVLIRFLREGISSLNGDLGNVKSHYFRIKELENMNTKNGFKMAERKRRLLNMILFGQAGLSTGSMHLDQLLLILRGLLDNQSAEENATAALRNEIEEHWRVIFSAFPHPNYETLLQSYSKLDVKNRMKSLNIESLLAEQPRKPPATSTVTVGQEEKAPPAPSMQQQPNTPAGNRQPKQRAVPNVKSPRQVPPPPVWQHVETSPPQSFMQQQQQQQQQITYGNNRTPKQRPLPNSRSPGQRQGKLPPPPVWLHEQTIALQMQQQEQQDLANYNNNNHTNHKNRTPKRLPYAATHGPQQQRLLPFSHTHRLPGKLQLHCSRPLQSECVKLLADMERGPSTRINTDASKPSMFWSRESLKYLDELFKLTNNSETILRLNRVLERSRQGQLSHNDYRAVIRLHSMMGSH